MKRAAIVLVLLAACSDGGSGTVKPLGSDPVHCDRLVEISDAQSALDVGTTYGVKCDGRWYPLRRIDWFEMD